MRRTPGENDAAEQAIRILCFGGSTMMGMGARDEHTIPALLACRLEALGHRVSVTNFGQLGHNSTQESITLQQLLKSGERIDIAVFYDGINEMACAEQTGRADRLFNEGRRRAEFNLLRPERRRDVVKHLHKVLEEHRTAVRNVRRDGNDALKKLAKDKKISEDEEKRAMEEVQKMTDEEIRKMEEMARRKEIEVMQV